MDIPASSNAVDTASHALKSLGGSSVAEEEEQSAVIRYHRAYLSGAATPSQVAERIITALQESDAMSPPMRFLISHDPEKLRSQAAASTLRYASGTPLSVLDGVPFAMKDEADVEGYPTTAGTAFIAKE